MLGCYLGYTIKIHFKSVFTFRKTFRKTFRFIYLFKICRMYFFLEKPNSDLTTINIIYYLKFEKKNFKYSTKQKISPKDWDFESRYPKLKRGGAGKKSKHISLKLDQYKNLLEDTIREFDVDNRPLKKKHLKSRFDKKFKPGIVISVDGPENNSLVAGISYFIELKSKSKGVSKDWKNKYFNLRNKISLFDLYRSTTTFYDDFGVNWLDEYTGFLRSLPKKLKNPDFSMKVKSVFPDLKTPNSAYNDNTLNRHITYLFTFLNWSKGDLHHLDLDKIQNPVKDFHTDDVHLTASELKLLEDVVLNKESLQRAKDLFLIGVYSGQRFSDYSVFESADLVGDLIIKRSKKKKKDSFIPLHDKLKNLLEKYEWQLPKISSQKFNPHIKKVLRIAGVTEKVKQTNYIGNKKEVTYFEKCDVVGSHTARRTFITLAAEGGMPDHIIMKITGIEDPKTLLKYKKTNQKTVAEFMNKMWS